MEIKAIDPEAKLPRETTEGRSVASIGNSIPWAAIIGVDGSGKSTVLRRLQERSAELPLHGIEVLHRRPEYVYQAQRADRGEITHYSKPNHGRFKSILKIAAMILDWEVGYWTYVRRRWAEGYFVIADRHSLLDMLADPDRYRYGGSPGFVHLAVKLAPIPPIIFLLDAPIEVLQDRKQELSAARLLQLKKSYQEIFKNWPGCILLDASRPVDEVVSDLLHEITERLGGRRNIGNKVNDVHDQKEKPWR